MKTDDRVARILEEIGKGRRFLIATHESPDGDAIGSSLAMANFLDGIGKEVHVFLPEPVPETYTFLPRAERIVNAIPEGDIDTCFIMDVGEFRRAGKAIGCAKNIRSFINIDHHLSSEDFGAVNFVDPSASATGALIHRIVKASGHPIDYSIALCIYTAVLTDTGCFRYSNSDPEAFAVAGEMVSAGVNAWHVAEMLYESQPKSRLQLLSRCLSTLDVAPCGNLASVTVTLDMYASTGSGPEDTDGFVNYPRSIRGVEVAVFFREVEPGLFKVGFRSKGKVNVAELAGRFGGGGHHNAAGCTVRGTADEVRSTVFGILSTLL